MKIALRLSFKSIVVGQSGGISNLAALLVLTEAIVKDCKHKHGYTDLVAARGSCLKRLVCLVTGTIA